MLGGKDMMNLNNLAITLALIFSFAFPIGMVIWWKKKTDAKLWPFIVGAICFTLFAMVLEQLLHTFCVVLDNPVSKLINGNPVAFMLYGALAAGIFEETGRLFGFKVLLKKYNDKNTAVAYGIGHGGIEVILLLGFTYLFYFLAICGVSVGTEKATQTLLGTAGAIDVGTVCMAMFERISTMIVHISLSMIVFVAAKQRGKLWLYPVAILMHALLDAPAALFQSGVPIPMIALEAEIFAVAIVYFFIGKKLLNGYQAEEGISGQSFPSYQRT